MTGQIFAGLPKIYILLLGSKNHSSTIPFIKTSIKVTSRGQALESSRTHLQQAGCSAKLNQEKNCCWAGTMMNAGEGMNLGGGRSLDKLTGVFFFKKIAPAMSFSPFFEAPQPEEVLRGAPKLAQCFLVCLFLKTS